VKAREVFQRAAGLGLLLAGKTDATLGQESARLGQGLTVTFNSTLSESLTRSRTSAICSSFSRVANRDSCRAGAGQAMFLRCSFPVRFNGRMKTIPFLWT
jgi:hypothetical protein